LGSVKKSGIGPIWRVSKYGIEDHLEVNLCMGSDR
jgi:hypothetical protein